MVTKILIHSNYWMEREYSNKNEQVVNLESGGNAMLD